MYYYDVGIPPFAIAISLKISETSFKNILKENKRSGPLPTFTQAYNTWLYLNQQSGEPVLIDISKDFQYREQKLQEKINEQEVRITQLSDDVEKATGREQIEKQESEKKSKALEDLIKKNIALTDERVIEKQKNEKLQDHVYKQYELIIKQERELGEEKTKVIKQELENKTIRKEHHDELEKISEGVTTLITKFKLSEEMVETLTRKNYQLEKEALSQKEKANRSFRDGIAIGGIGGTALGALCVVSFLKFSENTSHMD